MRWKSDLLLLSTTALWGTGFVAQRYVAGYLGTFTFNSMRFLLAGLLILLVLILSRRGRVGDLRLVDHQSPGILSPDILSPDILSPGTRPPASFLPGMALAGVFLFAAAGFQQAGLATTTIGNASFITGLYVVLVPVILFVALHQPVSWLSWLAVLVAAAGVAMLSLTSTFRLSPGDALELIGALMWALHIIQVGRLSRRGADLLVFSTVQFLVCGLLNLAVAFVLEPGEFGSALESWAVVLYSAAVPIGLGFTLQIAGQKHASLVDSAILLSMEAVFATLFGYLFLQETLALRQGFGCGLILAAMILAQLRSE
jgi:drug/metabolite transporter (DMT)-like permease